MKKLIITFSLLFLPLCAFSSGNFSFWGGYGFVNPVFMNWELENAYFDSGASLHRVENAYTAGMDGAYWYYSWWGIGGRLAFTQLEEGFAAGISSGHNVKYSAGGSVLQAMAGVPLLFEFFDGAVSVGGGIYCGLGYGTAYDKLTDEILGNSVLNSFGTGLVFEIPIRISWHMTSSYLVEVDFSWKSARIPMKGPACYEVDFSGFMIGGGFNWRFSSHDWPWYEKKWSWTE